MDTIVFVITKELYKVILPNNFKDPFEPINGFNFNERLQFARKYKCLKKYVQNASIETRRDGRVYPSLTIYERVRGSEYTCDLHIAVSLPKLKNGHSFKDVYTEERDDIIQLLLTRLKEMGVETTQEAILNAQINTIHYAINITFPSEQHTRMFLARMSKVSIGGWFEKNTRIYSNDGHAVRFHSDTFQIVFYMKYYDLFETKGRSIDKRKTLQEEQIAKKLKEKGAIPPVVRLEIRFVGKRSVSNHFEDVIGIKQSSWTFKEVFSNALSRQVLKYYWNKIISDKLNFILLADFSDEDICRKVLEKFKKLELTGIVDSLGMFYLLTSLGVKDLRDFVIIRKSRPTWYRERRKIVEFINRYIKPNAELMDIVSNALENNIEQLQFIELN